MPIQLQWPFKRILQQQVEPQEKRAPGGVNIPGELFDALYRSDSTTSVTVENASTLSAVYQSIQIHANSLNLPISVFKLIGGDTFQVTSDDEYEYRVHRLLHTSPNLMHTPSEWIQLMEMSRLLYGNGYSYIVRNGIKEPTALMWLHPDRIEVSSNGVEIKYNIKTREGGGYWKQDVSALDMIHVKAISYDGIVGQSPIDVAQESLGLAKNTQNAGSKYFASGMRQAVVLTHPGSMTPVGQAKLGQQFDKQLKADKTIVLEEGIRVDTLSFTPEQSQFLSTNEFNVTEVARWFNLPESFLENNGRATWSNVEQKMLWFVVNNLRPRVRMYEQQFHSKLLGNSPLFSVEFNLTSLLCGDSQARAVFYVQMVQNGIMSRNEIRRLENLNKIDGGDEFLTPLNLATDKERDQTYEDNESNKAAEEEGSAEDIWSSDTT